MRARSLVATLMLTMGMAVTAVPAMAQDSGSTGGAADSGGAAPAPAPAPADGSARTGGQEYGAENPAATPLVEGLVAQLLADGTAAAPAMAPPAVQQAIWSANEIVGRPYVYGGGHNRAFRSRGYDCSGTVSYALHGGNLLDAPLDSSSFLKWGERGPGQWITVYTNPSHAFVVIAGLRLDTSTASDPSGARGPRWRPARSTTRGFHTRHPLGF